MTVSPSSPKRSSLLLPSFGQAESLLRSVTKACLRLRLWKIQHLPKLTDASWAPGFVHSGPCRRPSIITSSHVVGQCRDSEAPAHQLLRPNTAAAPPKAPDPGDPPWASDFCKGEGKERTCPSSQTPSGNPPNKVSFNKPKAELPLALKPLKAVSIQPTAPTLGNHSQKGPLGPAPAPPGLCRLRGPSCPSLPTAGRVCW